MASFASGSGSGYATARDADAGSSALESGKEAEADCGHISASQMDHLAGAHFLSGGAVEGEEEAEVFSTPPLTPQDPQMQGQSQRGQAGEGEDEDGIVMCSVPFTQTQRSPSPSSSPPSDSWELKPRKRRICTRKVRGGAKVRTPTPTPAAATTATATATPIPNPSTGPGSGSELDPRNPNPSPGPGSELDPLVRYVLMVPSRPHPTSGYEDMDILELARRRGIF